MIELTDERYAELWENIDWRACEDKLRHYQRQLTLATFRGETEQITRLQNSWYVIFR